MRGGAHGALLALALGALCARTAAAEPSEPVPAVAARAVPGDLQSPEQASTRGSAYTVPGGMWAFDIGALGIGGSEAVAKLGAAYGFGSGFEVEANLAHMGVGLLNLSAGWHFVDTRYFDLGVRAGFWYAHGAWLWIARSTVQSLVSKVDAVSVPMALTASAPLTRWLQLDLGTQYTYANIFGSTADGDSPFVDAEISIRQLFFQPGVRFFISDNTALELSAKLPAFTKVPREGGDATVPFSRTWSMEAGLRSRLSAGVFANLRLRYGKRGDAVYAAPLYPSFGVEFRL